MFSLIAAAFADRMAYATTTAICGTTIVGIRHLKRSETTEKLYADIAPTVYAGMVKSWALADV